MAADKIESATDFYRTARIRISETFAEVVLAHNLHALEVRTQRFEQALAVTSLRRSSAARELPTIAESGYPGFEVTIWHGLLAPAKTPATIVRKLHLETVKVLALPDLRAKLADLGVEGIGNSPDEFAALIKSEFPKWAKVIKEAGIKPD